MSSLVTDAIVLHSFDYLESSRILRLLTRDGGVQSVLARGARRSRKRFGSAMDLFAQGTAEIHLKPGRELQTLAALDIVRARPGIGADVGRFTSAAMIAELILRFPYDDEAPTDLFDAAERALDAISEAPAGSALECALSGAWNLIARLGFTPALDICANCHAELDSAVSVVFSHSAGGALCPRCAIHAAGSRKIPAGARSAVRAWVRGEAVADIQPSEARAHQRLLREFFQEHLGTDRELRAFRVWEHGEWSAA